MCILAFLLYNLGIDVPAKTEFLTVNSTSSVQGEQGNRPGVDLLLGQIVLPAYQATITYLLYRKNLALSPQPLPFFFFFAPGRV